MFFPKLRRRAKWVFALLAVAFAIGFLAFGVGAGGTGVGDAIRDLVGAGSSDIPSVEKAQSDVEANPNDPEALSHLANALQAAGRNKEAIAALERYRKLRPDDVDGLRQLISLYEIAGYTAQQQANILAAQLTSGSLSAAAFNFPDTTGFIGAVGSDPIDEAISSRIATLAQEAQDETVTLSRQALPAYERLTELSPDEPILQLQLALAAEGAGEEQKAIAAYRRFLAASPEDPNAEFARDRLRVHDALPETTG
jgi:tetratricopeptide (TPR) repeat protein